MVTDLFVRIGRCWNDEMRDVVLEWVRAEAPVRTGALRSSLEVAVRYPPPFSRLEVQSPLPYLRYVLEGTRAHDIWPVHAKVLHWVGPDGDVFAAHVRHPGTRPNPFVRRAAQRLETESARALQKIAREETRDAVRQLAARLRG